MRERHSPNVSVHLARFIPILSPLTLSAVRLLLPPSLPPSPTTQDLLVEEKGSDMEAFFNIRGDYTLRK